MKLSELSRVGRALALVCIVVVLIALLLALAEGAVRLREFIKYGYSGGVEKQLVVDAVTGLRIPIPLSHDGPIRINSLGFRGPEITVPKPAGTIRIAFIGASTTFCAEVSSNAATWPEIVTGQLRQRFPGVRFDYVNSGVPGYGLTQMRMTLSKRVAALQPDIIVIYEATNALSGNSYDLAVQQGVISKRPDKERSWLSGYSLLYRLIELNLTIKSRQDRVEQKSGKLRVDLAALARPYRADLRTLVAEARAVAPVVAVVTFATQYRRGQPHDAQLKAAETSLYYMPYMTISGLLDSFDAYNAVMRDVARESGAVLIAGEDQIPGNPANFTDSVHFTDAGSRAQALRVSGVLQSAPEIVDLVRRTSQ